jgi:hypothetical protein
VYWRSLTRGEGRDLHPPPADLTMHSDAADVGYGGTLGMCSESGSNGLWKGRRLWSTEERAEPITLRELKAVRLLLQKNFAHFVAKAETKRVLLHENNQAVVNILNDMVSSSRPMMAELRRLEVMLRILGVKMEARWIPSAVNRYADALSRQWDPGDFCATESLVESLCTGYEPDAVVFPYRPVGEHPIARRNYLEAQMGEDWAMDGRVRHVTVGIEEDGGRKSAWSSSRSTVAGAALVRAVEQVGHADTRPISRPHVDASDGPTTAKPWMGALGGGDTTVEARGAVIRDAVLTRTSSSATGGASVAADLLSQRCWSRNTRATRSSQWRKWVGFCEQDERSIFPAYEGDVLAYIGFLRLEGRVSEVSIPQ